MKKYLFLLFFFILGSLRAEPIEKRLSDSIHVKEKENLIGYLTLGRDHPIDQSTLIYVKLALDDFKKKGVSSVVLDLNTPGGEVFAALEISRLLRNLDTNDHIPTVAFINDWALSAGAMLAYSCKFIGIVNTASMGAAEPVVAGEKKEMVSASEKINSALRAEFSNLAKFYGRDPLLAEAMVDKDIILVQRNGKIIKLDDEKEIKTGKNADIIISKSGKLLTLTAEQLMGLGVADFMVPPKSLAPLSNEEKKQGVWPLEKSLIAEAPFFGKIPDAKLVGFSDWKIDFFAFITHPAVASLLFVGLMIGIYGEMSHPGMGFPAILALSCLGLILLSQFAVQAVNWMEVIILLTGIVILLLELFVLPTFGILGILGIVMTVGGLFALLLPSFEGFHFSFNSDAINLATMAVLEKLAWLSGAFLLALGIIALLAKFFTPRLTLLRRFVLVGEQNASEGFVAGPSVDTLPKVGSNAKAYSPLRPSGKIEAEGKIYDAITDGGFIEKDSSVVVLRIEGSKIIVKNRS